jgi:hypothetical protein
MSAIAMSAIAMSAIAKRKAVLFPIPGKDPSWSTAFSKYLEGIFTLKNTN